MLMTYLLITGKMLYRVSEINIRYAHENPVNKKRHYFMVKETLKQKLLSVVFTATRL